jgi:ABC-2 type transport system permease protein
MQYRVSFLLSSLGQFLVTGAEVLGVWALLERFGSVRGWTLPQVAFLYGLVNASFAVADALSTGFDRMGVLLKSGEFDRVLLRPRSTVLLLAGHEFAIRRVGRFLQGAIVLVWACAAAGIPWTIGRVALTAAAFLGAMCLFAGIAIVQATIAFWTVESLEVMNTLSYGGVETAQYPLPVYAAWFRRFFTYVVPLGCVVYFPSVAILGLDDALGTSRAFQCAAPLAGPLFLALSLQFWRLGVRRYTSTGS